MKNLHDLIRYTKDTLAPVYNPEEANSLAWQLIEHELGWNRLQISLRKHEVIGPQIWQKFTGYVNRLLQHEPLQYITGVAHFYGLELLVTQVVLIPRPETEELVQLIIREHQYTPHVTILDAGTGSGCIPVALSVNLPQATVYGLDISTAALAVAQANGRKYQQSIQWLQHDIFTDPWPLPLQSLDVLVSNPPYVLESEKTLMRRNVLDFEPHLALFVPDNNALLYYIRIAEVAQQVLKPAGRLYFEINEQYGPALVETLTNQGFRKPQIMKDLFGKDRLVTAAWAG